MDAFRVGSAPVPSHPSSTLLATPYEALLFKMTVGKSHPTKLNGVKKVMEKVRKDLHSDDIKCAVVFVVPDDVRAFCEKPQAVTKNDGSVRLQHDKDFNHDNQYCLVIDYNRSY